MPIDIKWVEKQNYHVTVKFLGDVDAKTLPGLQKALASAAASNSVFHLSAGGVGFFPRKNRPRVIFLGMQGDMDKLRLLSQEMDTSLQTFGFEREKHPKFHLTLGRFSSERGIEQMFQRLAQLECTEEHLTFAVTSFLLMKSELSNQGPHYSVIQEYLLEAQIKIDSVNKSIL